MSSLQRTDNALHPNTVLAERLMRVYVSGQQFNSTARYIIDRLSVLDEDGAYNMFVHDGDKLPRYTRWAREFTDLLYTELGCRLHRVKGCQRVFCKVGD